MAESMTEEKQTIKESAAAAKRGISKAAEGEPTQALWEIQKAAPSSVYMYAAGASILASAILFARRSRDWALFVGQWAPTLLVSGLFFKLLYSRKESTEE
ncbi:MAG: hypothetical protein ABFD64_02530 [Armatimonadota bacterium]